MYIKHNSMANSMVAIIVTLIAACVMPQVVRAEETEQTEQTEQKNEWGAKLIKSPFGLGLDIQTKYVWRGMEMMPENSAPVLFPSVNFQWEGLFVYAMGGYAVNGKYAEVDAGVSYTYKGFTLGVYDYYYPSVDSKQDKYLKGGSRTGHWLEAALTYAPEKLPFWITVSNFFCGADKYTEASGREKRHIPHISKSEDSTTSSITTAFRLQWEQLRLNHATMVMNTIFRYAT